MTNSSHYRSASASRGRQPEPLYHRGMAILFLLLVASLPFFSVRNPVLVLSPPLILLLLISGIVMLKAVMTFRMPISISLLDACLISYIALIVVNLAIVPNAEGAKLAFIKTVVYAFAYLCLKMSLRDLSIGQIATSARYGALLGTILFSVAVVGCVAITGRVGELTTFNYANFTGTIFRSIDQVLGSGAPEDFESKDIMRNAVAEAFAFFFLTTLVFRFVSPAKNMLLQLANIILVVITFSRRAFFGIAIVLAGSSFKDMRGLKRGVVAALIVAAVFASTFLLQDESSENRLLDVSDNSRSEMYADGLELFTQNPVFGTGFGSKLERGSYVHNFVIGSGAMLGMAGFLLALTIYSSVIIQFLKSLANPRIIEFRHLSCDPHSGHERRRHF